MTMKSEKVNCGMVYSFLGSPMSPLFLIFVLPLMKLTLVDKTLHKDYHKQIDKGDKNENERFDKDSS